MGAVLSDRELLARLVSFDTVSIRPNAPLVEWIADYLDRPGVRVEVQEGGEVGKANLIALAGTGEGDAQGAGLTLSGHLDVVPADEPQWESDPFELVARDGALFGRGTCDMKAFCALAINRLAGAGPLDAPLGLLLTYDEEIGCHGVKRFVDHYDGQVELPRSVLVGEPTELAVVRMHKGHLRLRIAIEGRSAHTGSPHLGVSAIEPAGPILAALARLRLELEEERSPESEYFGEVPYTVLAVAGIRGGEAMNIIPSACELDVGVRPLPGVGTDELLERVRVVLPSERVRLEMVDENPPLLTPVEAPLHRELLDLLGQSGSRGMPYASDGGWLAAAGYECVLCGPGRTAVMHRPNENVSLAELDEGGRFLDELIGRVCGGNGG